MRYDSEYNFLYFLRNIKNNSLIISNNTKTDSKTRRAYSIRTRIKTMLAEPIYAKWDYSKSIFH